MHENFFSFTLVTLKFVQSKLRSSSEVPKEIFLEGRRRNEDRFMDITCIIRPFKRTPSSRTNYLQHRSKKERKRKDFPQFYYHINPKWFIKKFSYFKYECSRCSMYIHISISIFK